MLDCIEEVFIYLGKLATDIAAHIFAPFPLFADEVEFIVKTHLIQVYKIAYLKYIGKRKDNIPCDLHTKFTELPIYK